MTKQYLKKIVDYLYKTSMLVFVIIFSLSFIILLLKGFESFNVKVLYINTIPLTIIIITFFVSKKLDNNENGNTE